MTDVFISYSHKDEELAASLQERFELEGLKTFLASVSLPKGEKWSPNIMDALRQSKWVFVLATSDGLGSEAVQHEISGAVYGDKSIVPIMVGIEPSELPPWLSEYQGVKVKEADAVSIGRQVDQIATTIRSQKTTSMLVTAGLIAFAAYFLLKK